MQNICYMYTDFFTGGVGNALLALPILIKEDLLLKDSIEVRQ